MIADAQTDIEVNKIARRRCSAGRAGLATVARGVKSFADSLSSTSLTS